MAELDGSAKRRISLELPIDMLAQIDALKAEWGHRNRGDTLERLLHELLDEDDAPAQEVSSDTLAHPPRNSVGELDEQLALVLVSRGSLTTGDSALDARPESPPVRRSGSRIDLPGFVRQRSDRLRGSLRPPPRSASAGLSPLPTQSAAAVSEAMNHVQQHWLELYGKSADDTVLEAAMLWLATDIWTHSDQSEGRPFTWSLLCRVMADLVPGWSDGSASFERVMVAAGVLEDPFSASTLSLRIPTLIRRFVHRFRRRRTGTSFDALEHTMTLQGALRLLELPTGAGQRLTLAQIRDAYREMALAHHPDSGGSVEMMRRLNEAYQLLKELYRHSSSSSASLD